MKNRQLSIEHGIVVVEDGVGNVVLPRTLDRPAVEALLSTGIDEPNFLPRLFERVSWDDRQRFAQAAEAVGLAQPWAVLAMNWASVHNQDCRWRLEEFNIVYSYAVESWWLDQVLVAATDHRFAVSNGMVMSFVEFFHMYGTSVTDHLYEFAQHQAEEIRMVADQLQGRLVRRKIAYVDANGQVNVGVFSGLETVPTDRWLVPPGVTLLDSGELVATVPSTKEDCP
jgi:hypothetical protein